MLYIPTQYSVPIPSILLAFTQIELILIKVFHRLTKTSPHVDCIKQIFKWSNSFDFGNWRILWYLKSTTRWAL